MKGSQGILGASGEWDCREGTVGHHHCSSHQEQVPVEAWAQYKENINELGGTHTYGLSYWGG